LFVFVCFYGSGFSVVSCCLLTLVSKYEKSSDDRCTVEMVGSISRDIEIVYRERSFRYRDNNSDIKHSILIVVVLSDG